MHIMCPHCDKVINAKDQEMFHIWECPRCEWRFRGVHAGQPHLRNLINQFIAPYYTGPAVWDLGICPHCGSIVDLNWIGTHTKKPRSEGPYPGIGYNGPYVCKRCCNPLPWDYPEQYPYVAEEFNRQKKEEEERKRSKVSQSIKKSSAKSDDENFDWPKTRAATEKAIKELIAIRDKYEKRKGTSNVY